MLTASGNTAVRLARERPAQPLLVLSPEHGVERRLSLLWGTQTAHQAESSYEDAVEEAVSQIKHVGWPGRQINRARFRHALWACWDNKCASRCHDLSKAACF